MIAEYAATLAGRLRFDPALAERVQAEVENHLQEAVEAGSDPASAIARFGEPRALAAQFAASALAAHVKRAGATVLLVLAAAFLAMKTRTAWYDVAAWALSESAAGLAALLGSVDRIAFYSAALAGIAAFACAGRHRVLLWRLAAVALATSVLCDGLLTALRLADRSWSADFLVPLASMGVELACATALVLRLRAIARRTEQTEALEG